MRDRIISLELAEPLAYDKMVINSKSWWPLIANSSLIGLVLMAKAESRGIHGQTLCRLHSVMNKPNAVKQRLTRKCNVTEFLFILKAAATSRNWLSPLALKVNNRGGNKLEKTSDNHSRCAL